MSRRLLTAAPLAVVALTSLAPAVGALSPPRAGGFPALDEFLEQRAAEGLAFVAAVARNDEIVFARGYGLADQRRRIANRTGTAFGVGSITKTCTAAGVYRLARHGEGFQWNGRHGGRPSSPAKPCRSALAPRPSRRP